MSKKEKIIDPGRKSYFFGKGYVDLWNTIKSAWVRNIESFNEQKANASFSWEGAIPLIAAICIIFYGSLITLATTVIHAGVLILFFMLIYIGFSIVWVIDRIYIHVNKIKNACPNPDCQAAFLIPMYQCPKCGKMHKRLTPGTLGILHRTCECGQKLPTTFLNGRGNLSASCPVCTMKLSGNTASRQYAIPVIGGPSVGKTCYINMTIKDMVTRVAPSKNWKIDFISEADRKNFENAERSIEKGIRPLKTESDSLTAFQMMITLPNEKIGRRLYLYDIAGEMFSSSMDIQRNNAYNYANGFIFMIDPLSIDRFAMRMEDKIDLKSYGVSSKSFDDILNIMLINLEKMFGLTAKDILNMNIAVVINKMDIPTLEEEIGREAVQRAVSESNVKLTASDAANALCKKFLEDNEEGNFVRSIDSKFKKVRYFTCSALGHNNEGEAFEGYGVTEPLIWLLEQADPKITS